MDAYPVLTQGKHTEERGISRPDRADPGPDYPFEQVVKIHVETASEVCSPICTLTKASEAEVKRFWLERYGYRSAREVGRRS